MGIRGTGRAAPSGDDRCRWSSSRAVPWGSSLARARPYGSPWPLGPRHPQVVVRDRYMPRTRGPRGGGSPMVLSGS